MVDILFGLKCLSQERKAKLGTRTILLPDTKDLFFQSKKCVHKKRKEMLNIN